MANTWGESGTTWSQGNWGEQNNSTITLSGLLTTSSLGTPDAYPEQGWGRFAWGQKDWGDNSLSVTLTGLSITGHLGTLAAAAEQGWGRDTWGAEIWGDSYDPVIPLTGYSITAALGTLPYAQSEEGWGRDEWGYGNWGENTTTVVLTDSFEMTAGFGPSGWGIAPWEEQVSWGGTFILTTTQLSIVALTGLEMTGSVGTPTYAFDMINFSFSGPSQIGAGLGVPNINDGADHTQGVGSLLATGSVGSLDHEMTYPLTGLEATGYVGSPTITQAILVPITDSLLATGYVGSTTIDDMAVGLSGLQATGSVGSITSADMVIGLTGLSATALVNDIFSILAYKDIDISGNTSYTDVDITGNTSYTDVDHAG